MHERSSFVTLTYRDEELPDVSAGSKAWLRDWQLFRKRLREAAGEFRFFGCAEYGDRFHRPHFHVLLFGLGFEDDRYAWRRRGRHQLFRSPLLEETWGKGNAELGEVEVGSAAYVCGYVLGGQSPGPRGQVPPFVFMSRRPGIGAKWFAQFDSDVFPEDELVVAGRHFPVPRYYASKLSESQVKALKAARRRKRAMRKELSVEELRNVEGYVVSQQSMYSREIE